MKKMKLKVKWLIAMIVTISSILGQCYPLYAKSDFELSVVGRVLDLGDEGDDNGKNVFLYEDGTEILCNINDSKANVEQELSGSIVKTRNTAKNTVIECEYGNSIHAIVRADGSLWTWGNDMYTILGNGTTDISLSPVKIMDKVETVCVGYNHAAAIKKDGSLWTWGHNSSGQLGDGTTDNSTIPIKVMDDVKSVSAGYNQTAAIKKDGSLWTWGYNDYGKLGRSSADNTKPGMVMENVKAISVGESHNLAIKNDGSLWAWGCNRYGELGNNSDKNFSNVPIKIMDDVEVISAGYECSAAIKSDGSLWMWGSNSNGQLGDMIADGIDSRVPIKMMDDVQEVCAPYQNHGAVIKKDGSLWTWGKNFSGQLGNGSTEESKSPIKILNDVVAVSAKFSQTAVIKGDGSLWAWGSGGLGNGSSFDKLSPVQILFIDENISSVDEYNIHNPIVDDENKTTWDCIWFGHYLQDDTNGDDVVDKNDEKSPIKWRVLSAKGNNAFLISDECLDFQGYSTSIYPQWANSHIRNWLKEVFINEAFDSDEIYEIQESYVKNNVTWKDSNTEDHIYLLSSSELFDDAYGFTTAEARRTVATKYAKGLSGFQGSSWILRDSSDDENIAKLVSGDGEMTWSYYDSARYYIRPVMHLNLDSTVWKHAGTVCSDGSVDEVSGEKDDEIETQDKESPALSFGFKQSKNISYDDGYNTSSFTINLTTFCTMQLYTDGNIPTYSGIKITAELPEGLSFSNDSIDKEHTWSLEDLSLAGTKETVTEIPINIMNDALVENFLIKLTLTAEGYKKPVLHNIIIPVTVVNDTSEVNFDNFNYDRYLADMYSDFSRKPFRNFENIYNNSNLSQEILDGSKEIDEWLMQMWKADFGIGFVTDPKSLFNYKITMSDYYFALLLKLLRDTGEKSALDIALSVEGEMNDVYSDIFGTMDNIRKCTKINEMKEEDISVINQILVPKLAKCRNQILTTDNSFDGSIEIPSSENLYDEVSDSLDKIFESAEIVADAITEIQNIYTLYTMEANYKTVIKEMYDLECKTRDDVCMQMALKRVINCMNDLDKEYATYAGRMGGELVFDEFWGGVMKKVKSSNPEIALILIAFDTGHKYANLLTNIDGIISAEYNAVMMANISSLTWLTYAHMGNEYRKNKSDETAKNCVVAAELYKRACILNIDIAIEYIDAVKNSYANQLQFIIKSWFTGTNNLNETIEYANSQKQIIKSSMDDINTYLLEEIKNIYPNTGIYEYVKNGGKTAGNNRKIKNKYVIACPVDVRVDSQYGESYITDSFIHSDGTTVIGRKDDQKIVYAFEEDDLKIDIIGTDVGSMMCKIYSYNDDEVKEVAYYNVPITRESEYHINSFSSEDLINETTTPINVLIDINENEVKQKKHTISLIVNGGYIEESLNEYSYGDLAHIVASVPYGKKFVKWDSSKSLQGVIKDEESPYTEINIPDSDITINAITKDEFDVYHIKSSCGSGGLMNLTGDIAVAEMESAIFGVFPGDGYKVDKVIVDGRDVGPLSSYIFENISADHTIEAVFVQSEGNPKDGSTDGKEVSVTGVKLNNNSLKVKKGETITLTSTIKPTNASNTSVQWDFSNISIIDLSSISIKEVSAGVSTLTAKTISAGSTKLTVTTDDGKYTDVCEITVTGEDGDGQDKKSSQSMNAISLTAGGDSYTILYTSSVSYNGCKHVGVNDRASKKKSNDIEVIIYLNGELCDGYKPMFKNNKKVGTKKKPHFTLKLDKSHNKIAKKILRKRKLYFDITPADLSRDGGLEFDSIKLKNGKARIKGLKYIDPSTGNGTKMREGIKKDYVVKKATVSTNSVVIQGMNNYYGTVRIGG